MGPWQNPLYYVPREIQIYRNAIWAQDGTMDLPENDGSHPCLCKLVAFFALTGEHRRILESHWEHIEHVMRVLGLLFNAGVNPK